MNCTNNKQSKILFIQHSHHMLKNGEMDVIMWRGLPPHLSTMSTRNPVERICTCKKRDRRPVNRETDGERSRRGAAAGPPVRARARRLPRRVELVQSGHRSAVCWSPRRRARHGRVRRQARARGGGGLVRGVQPAAAGRAGGAAARGEGRAGGPQLRRPEPGAGHAGAPGQGRRRCLRLRRHAGRREAPQVRLRTVRARKGPGFLHGQRDRDHRRRRPGARLQDVPARAGVHGAATVSAQPSGGPDAGDDAGEAVAAVRGRRRDERGGGPDGGEVRRGEPRVRGRRGGHLVVAGVPAADGVVEPRHGDEEPRGGRSHAHVLQVQGALGSPRGDSQQVHLKF